VLLLDLDDRKAIRTPAQAFGNLLNILLMISVLTGIGLIKEGEAIDIVRLAGFIFFTLLVVTILTRVLYNGTDWTEILALNLNLVTFWIAVTVLFILFALFIGEVLDFDYTQMGQIALCPLIVLIPLHIIRSRLSVKQKLLYVPLLFACTLPVIVVFVFPLT
jgi:hypothetical protein